MDHYLGSICGRWKQTLHHWRVSPRPCPTPLCLLPTWWLQMGATCLSNSQTGGKDSSVEANLPAFTFTTDSSSLWHWTRGSTNTDTGWEETGGSDWHQPSHDCLKRNNTAMMREGNCSPEKAMINSWNDDTEYVCVASRHHIGTISKRENPSVMLTSATIGYLIQN